MCKSCRRKLTDKISIFKQVQASEQEEKKLDKAPEKADQQDLEKKMMERAAEELKEMMAKSPGLQNLLGAVDVKVEADGLNVEIMDTEKSSMFSNVTSTDM